MSDSYSKEMRETEKYTECFFFNVFTESEWSIQVHKSKRKNIFPGFSMKEL